MKVIFLLFILGFLLMLVEVTTAGRHDRRKKVKVFLIVLLFSFKLTK